MVRAARLIVLATGMLGLRQPLRGYRLTSSMMVAAARAPVALDTARLVSERHDWVSTSQLRRFRSLAVVISADASGNPGPSAAGPSRADCGEPSASLPAVPTGPSPKCQTRRPGLTRRWFALATPSPGITFSASASSGQTTSGSPGASTNPNGFGWINRVGSWQTAAPRYAWRATVGGCSNQGMIELSTNAGASWRPVLRTALGPIVRLGTGVEGDLYAIGGSGQNCSAKYVAYGKDGTVMASTNRPVDVWFPHQATMTKSTDRATPKPRLARSRSSASLRLTLSRALVVCDDIPS
jgi:hypothetical protein